MWMPSSSRRLYSHASHDRAPPSFHLAFAFCTSCTPVFLSMFLEPSHHIMYIAIMSSSHSFPGPHHVLLSTGIRPCIIPSLYPSVYVQPRAVSCYLSMYTTSIWPHTVTLCFPNLPYTPPSRTTATVAAPRRGALLQSLRLELGMPAVASLAFSAAIRRPLREAAADVPNCAARPTSPRAPPNERAGPW
jgi:hypothetical protein